MINLFVGQNVYLSYKDSQEVTQFIKISGMVSPIPDEIQDDDYIVVLNHNGQEISYGADHTATRNGEHASPEESDEEWSQLILAAIGKTGLPVVKSISIAVSAPRWNETLYLESRIKGLQGTLNVCETIQLVEIEKIVMYPAMIAELYDLFSEIDETGELKGNESILEDRIVVVSIHKRHSEWVVMEGLEKIAGGIFYFGINQIVLDIRDYYYERTNKNLSPYEADAALYNRKFEIKEGKFESLNRLIETSGITLKEKLSNEINVVCDNYQVSRIFYTGEGAKYINPDEDSEIVVDPEYAPVRGLEKLNLLMGNSTYV